MGTTTESVSDLCNSWHKMMICNPQLYMLDFCVGRPRLLLTAMALLHAVIFITDPYQVPPTHNYRTCRTARPSSCQNVRWCRCRAPARPPRPPRCLPLPPPHCPSPRPPSPAARRGTGTTALRRSTPPGSVARRCPCPPRSRSASQGGTGMVTILTGRRPGDRHCTAGPQRHRLLTYWHAPVRTSGPTSI